MLASQARRYQFTAATPRNFNIRSSSVSIRLFLSHNRACVFPFAIACVHVRLLFPTTTFRLLQGFGTLLMEEAERIARDEHGSLKLAVISGAPLGNNSFSFVVFLGVSHLLSLFAGVGTRHYYRKLGYHLDGPYMSKWLWPAS